MDWLRRNWPDLLIGMALVAVIAGIVTTLLSGGSFLPLGGQEGPVESSRTPPGMEAEGPLPPALDERAAEEVESIIPVRPGEPGEEDGPVVAPDRVTDEAEEEVTITPERPGAEQPAPPAVEQEAEREPVQATADVSDVEPSYRVGVGAFSNEENANRRAQQFRNEGFPVFIGRQGDFYLVLVGPFDEQDEAASAATRIRDTGIEPDARVFEFVPETAEEPEVDAEPAVALVEQVDEPAQLDDAPELAEDGARRYLQVGAYLSRQAAEPQLESMQEMGFEVTFRELPREDETLYRLLIGPFGPSELAAVQERLSERDIEHFATD